MILIDRSREIVVVPWYKKKLPGSFSKVLASLELSDAQYSTIESAGEIKLGSSERRQLSALLRRYQHDLISWTSAPCPGEARERYSNRSKMMRTSCARDCSACYRGERPQKKLPWTSYSFTHPLQSQQRVVLGPMLDHHTEQNAARLNERDRLRGRPTFRFGVGHIEVLRERIGKIDDSGRRLGSLLVEDRLDLESGRAARCVGVRPDDYPTSR
jgi:hypothetical protein